MKIGVTTLMTFSSFLIVGLALADDHDSAVNAAVKGHLNSAFAQRGEIAAGIRIQSALASATAAREQPGKSTDLVLRDAEYYLHGLYAASNRDTRHALAVAGSPIYEAFKYIALELEKNGYPWLAKKFQTSDQPLSKPGGWQWAWKGLKDGVKIDGNATVSQRTSGHGLSLSLP